MKAMQLAREEGKGPNIRNGEKNKQRNPRFLNPCLIVGDGGV